ncbi:NTF2 fold immunity protein [Novosphingobium sp. FSW06-99]|uniref:NTF2 fold immunity protein n=1 Tax=Novosphingobium sp. FSW06-99 TaxID=1739113 RepID=UPI001E43C956|nr:NTF2 fold immunity protein [Novosphingobium sp. FSW06-99]
MIFSLWLLVVMESAYGKGANEMKAPRLEIQQLLFGGIVKNKNLALRLGEAIISDIYGNDELKLQRPFSVSEDNGIWTIVGSKNAGEGREGEGCVIIKIARDDARVIDIKRLFIVKNRGK